MFASLCQASGRGLPVPRTNLRHNGVLARAPRAGAAAGAHLKCIAVLKKNIIPREISKYKKFNNIAKITISSLYDYHIYHKEGRDCGEIVDYCLIISRILGVK